VSQTQRNVARLFERDSSRIDPVIRLLVVASVAQHVGVGLDAKLRRRRCSLDHAAKSGADNGAPRSETKTKGDLALSL
jgi:hypothetical protein